MAGTQGTGFDLVNVWSDRFDYMRQTRLRGPIKPEERHLVLLRRSFWDWNDYEFGAPSMDPKRPYGNSDVENDLAELLPELTPEQRLRTHCELPAVIAFLVKHIPEVS